MCGLKDVPSDNHRFSRARPRSTNPCRPRAASHLLAHPRHCIRHAWEVSGKRPAKISAALRNGCALAATLCVSTRCVVSRASETSHSTLRTGASCNDIAGAAREYFLPLRPSVVLVPHDVAFSAIINTFLELASQAVTASRATDRRCLRRAGTRDSVRPRPFADRRRSTVERLSHVARGNAEHCGRDLGCTGIRFSFGVDDGGYW